MLKTMKTISAAVAAATIMIAGADGLMAAGDAPHIEHRQWSFSGPGGRFDPNQLQRGFQVYKEVCSTCHGMKQLSFRNLMEKGGPAFPEDGVRSLAATYNVDEIDGNGKTVQRPARLSDRFPSPYKNEAEARSVHNGALPPDLSLMARARGLEYTGSLWYHPLSMLKDIGSGYQEAGADYIYALMMGYHENAPAYRRDGTRLVPIDDKDVKDPKAVQRCVAVEKGTDGKPDTCTPMAEGMHFNVAFPGHQTAMAPPLTDGRVTYSDGTPNTVANYAADVAAFLSWTADPSHDQRKRMGWQVMLYLLITSVLLYIAKKRIWSDAH